jgi:hypothetical protein
MCKCLCPVERRAPEIHVCKAHLDRDSAGDDYADALCNSNPFRYVLGR